MCSLRLKKSKRWIACFFLVATTSCGKFFPCCQEIEIPCHWHTPLNNGLNEDDPACFHWWEALGDPQLTELIEEATATNFDVRLAAMESEEKALQAANTVAADVARNYIELWGGQEKLNILRQQIECQKRTSNLTEGLSESGFLDDIEENENKNLLDLLYVEQSALEISINKTIFHISILLNEPPAHEYERLYESKKRLTVPQEMPLGNPRDLVERHPNLREAKKQYELSGSSKAFYNYEKLILTTLEDTENALAALQADSYKAKYLMDRKKNKEEAFHLTKDLYQRGLKGERDVEAIQQDLLSDKKSCVEGRVQLLIDYVNLYQALCGGWDVDCP